MNTIHTWNLRIESSEKRAEVQFKGGQNLLKDDAQRGLISGKLLAYSGAQAS